MGDKRLLCPSEHSGGSSPPGPLFLQSPALPTISCERSWYQFGLGAGSRDASTWTFHRPAFGQLEPQRHEEEGDCKPFQFQQILLWKCQVQPHIKERGVHPGKACLELPPCSPSLLICLQFLGCSLCLGFSCSSSSLSCFLAEPCGSF